MIGLGVTRETLSIAPIRLDLQIERATNFSDQNGFFCGLKMKKKRAG